jgi:monovalent cation/proton antiporter MnhG/PhaG subunit
MHTFVAILLGAGVVLTLAGAIPAAFRRDLMNRLHFAGVTAVAGVPLIAIASMCAAGNSGARVKAALVLIATAVLNPLLSHALARGIEERGANDGRGAG